MPRWTCASTLLAAGALAIGLLAGSSVSAQGVGREPGFGLAPGSVKDALGLMSRVVSDSGQLIASHHYDELPRESRDLEAGLATLERGLQQQPTGLRSKLQSLVGKARIASSAMTEAVEAHRDSMLPLAHRQLADAVSAIIATVPPDLRPAPGS